MRMIPLDEIQIWERNYRVGNVEIIASSIRRFGFNSTVRIHTGTVYAGNHSILALRAIHDAEDLPPLGIEVSRGRWLVPCLDISHLSKDEASAFAIADNRASDVATNDSEALAALLAELHLESPELVNDSGYSEDDLDALLRELAGQPEIVQSRIGTLAERWLMPPFTVLNARSGTWQARKHEWLASGLDSTAGRGENLIGGGGKSAYGASVAGCDAVTGELIYQPGVGGTSIFDPVLAEIAVKWFSGECALVLDPFAGGSVRGIVARRLGRKYLGVDLRPEQVAANIEQAVALEMVSDDLTWLSGDSRDILEICQGAQADLLFSCPPYSDLEVYSDDPLDLSAVEWPEFLEAYRLIIRNSCELLKNDRFAVWVVGEIRGKDGNYRGLVPETIRAFEEAGLRYYNEAILITQVGTLQFRVNKQFERARKLGKTHQNVLVFVKGDPRQAAEACGHIELPDEEEPVLA